MAGAPLREGGHVFRWYYTAAAEEAEEEEEVSSAGCDSRNTHLLLLDTREEKPKEIRKIDHFYAIIRAVRPSSFNSSSLIAVGEKKGIYI